MSGPQGIYSIGAVARMLGLSQATIRSWEERYRVIVAERSDGGRRIYTRDHVRQLQFVQARLDEGLAAADAHRLLVEQQEGRRPSAQPQTPTPSTQWLILLAESDRYSAELNEFFLRSAGYDVDVAPSADAAEEKFAARDPALTIVEMMISGGVGQALCERLKQLRGTPLLTVSSLDLREQAFTAGADAFLQKPLEPLRVLSTVKGLLGQSPPHHERSHAAG